MAVLEIAEPTKTVEEQALDAAVAWAREHGYKGDELPCGIPGPANCPLARATGYRIWPDRYYYGPGRSEALPEEVRKFVILFDRGQYPGLIA